MTKFYKYLLADTELKTRTSKHSSAMKTYKKKKKGKSLGETARTYIEVNLPLATKLQSRKNNTPNTIKQQVYLHIA